MTDKRYVHEEYTHDLSSPMEIVPILTGIFNPSSVVDVGCGIGTFLYCFKQQGVKEVAGIDGPWANKELVSKYLASEEFIECNLEESFNLKRNFDMAICLEVAEHLQPEPADKLINNLVSLSKIIVFSAAIPGQGGQNHINEQWMSYWQTRFSQHGYQVLDMLRPYFWENEKIHWWYRQNMFVIIHESMLHNEFKLPELVPGKILNYVHPGLLRVKQTEIDNIKSGKYPMATYLKFIFKKLFSPK